MTNREALIDLLQRQDCDADAVVASYLECPYTDKCDNPHEYGTVEFQMFCDDCKAEWLDREAEDGK